MEICLLFVIVMVCVLAVVAVNWLRRGDSDQSEEIPDNQSDTDHLLDWMLRGIREDSDIWDGNSAKSTDGNYILVWRDGALGENGRYLLSHQNNTLCFGDMVSPAYGGGAVADNGVFVLADCTGGLTSRFYAFLKDGARIMERSFRALPQRTGISKSGKYAVVQMASAPSKKDGGALVFFDLTTCMESWRITPDTGWADSYEFDDERAELKLVDRKYGTFRYSYEDGTFPGFGKMGAQTDTAR